MPQFRVFVARKGQC